MWGAFTSAIGKSEDFLGTYTKDLKEFATTFTHEASSLVSSLLSEEEGAAGAATQSSSSSSASASAKVVPPPSFEERLELLTENPDTFTEDVADDDFMDWLAAFDLDKQTKQIASLLKADSTLEYMHRTLVPESISYGLFWSRYFFYRSKLERDEERRKILEKGRKTLEEEESISWDIEEEKVEAAQPQQQQSQPEITPEIIKEAQEAAEPVNYYKMQAENVQRELEELQQKYDSLKKKYQQETDASETLLLDVQKRCDSLEKENIELKAQLSQLALANNKPELKAVDEKVVSLTIEEEKAPVEIAVYVQPPHPAVIQEQKKEEAVILQTPPVIDEDEFDAWG